MDKELFNRLVKEIGELPTTHRFNVGVTISKALEIFDRPQDLGVALIPYSSDKKLNLLQIKRDLYRLIDDSVSNERRTSYSVSDALTAIISHLPSFQVSIIDTRKKFI